jgi:hypothetical protein
MPIDARKATVCAAPAGSISYVARITDESLKPPVVHARRTGVPDYFGI